MLKTKGDFVANMREILDFCDRHNIVRDVALIPIQKVGEALSAMCKAPRDSTSRSTWRDSRSVCKKYLYAVGAWN